jgi:endonuclease YncB( thermonuclease family)
MRKLMAALVVMSAVALTTASPSSAQDRDCSDFSTQREAQLFFLRNGGPESDPHRLDDAFGQGNGIACESLPCPCYRGRSLPDGDNPSPPRRFQTIRSKIIRVIDGDTIVIRPLEPTKRSRYTVRLIGIDSPEKRPSECGSNLATENAQRLAPRGRRVLLKTDPTQPMFDRYDRLLAYVRLPSGRQLNRSQVAAGWAKVLVVGRRFQQYAEYKRYPSRAKREGLGAWGICGGMHVPS